MALRIVLVAFLAATSIASAGDSFAAQQTRLLAELSQCRAAMPRQATYFVAPCAGRKVWGLVGVSLKQAIEILGVPDLCGLPTGDIFERGQGDCAKAVRVRYAYYVLTGVGGGPELVLKVDASGKVYSAEWDSTR